MNSEARCCWSEWIGVVAYLLFCQLDGPFFDAVAFVLR